MVIWIVLEGPDKWDSGFGQHVQSSQCWCCVPPSESNSGSKYLLPLRKFSTHLHPSPINCLVYLHLAVPAKWEFALKRINVSLFTPCYHFLSLHLFVWLMLLTLSSVSYTFFLIRLIFSQCFSPFTLTPSIPSSLPLSLLLWNAEMKIIGEVSKMQIVWVS